MKENKNKGWAIVTGASSGIGLATAESLVEAGYSVYLVARREERLKNLATQLKKLNSKIDVKTAVVDVTKSSAVDKFFKAEAKNLKNVEVLVNNAGLAKGTEKVFAARTEDWDTMIDTNVKGLLYFTRGVLPHMIERKSGHIVNLGSVAGRWVYPGGAVYCASKFAVTAISEGLRMDLLGQPIRVTNIEPGMVNTEFSLVRFEDKKKAEQVYQNMTPLSAKDIADCILWCLQRPAHVNIQELVVFPTDQAAVGQVHRR
jgi:hypothetical protein